MMRTLCNLALVGAVASLALASASAQTVIFQDDFESGPSNWVFEPGWYLQTGTVPGCIHPPPHGTTAARFGQTTWCSFFGLGADAMTTLNAIWLPPTATAARLRFRSYEATECNNNCGWDHRFVQISTDGSNWVNAWEGGVNGLWIEKSVDLTSYRGQDVFIRFLFDPVDSWGNDFLGWMVDDVRVEVDEPGGPTIYCAPKVNSMGCGPLMSYSGDVSLSGPDDLVLSTSNLRNNVYGSFAWSTGVNNTPFQGGTLCVQIPARRTTTIATGGTPPPKLDCSGSYSWVFTQDYLTVNGIEPGETVHCQYFGRDVRSAAPMTLSNAVRVTILP